MRKRNRHVSVWMNEQEYRHLKKQAELAGLGIGPFLRALTAGVQLRPRPFSPFRPRSLCRIYPPSPRHP